jgi:hypothetical protein
VDSTSLVVTVIRVSEKAASLEPLYEVVSDPRAPYRQIRDPLAEFPNRGRLVWFDPPRGVQDRTIWLVEAAESLTYRKATSNSDEYMVAQGSSPLALIDVLDLRALGDEETIRRHATVEGLLLANPPAATTFLRVGACRFIGPVDFGLLSEGGRWRVRDVERPLASWVGREEDILRFGTLSARREVAVSRTWRRVGHVDWHANDLKLLAGVLRAAHKLDREFEPVQLTRKSLTRLEEILSGPLGSEAERELHQQRLRRVRSVLPHIEETAALGDEVLAAILEVPAIKLAIDRHRETVGAAVRQEVTERVTVALSKERRDAERLQGDNQRAARELELRRTEVGEQEARLAELVDSFEATLAARVREIAVDPPRFLADVVLLRAALGLPSGKPEGPITPVDAAAKSFVAPLNLSEPGQLLAALEVTFQTAEFSADTFRLIHAAFLAGAVPALIGGRAMDALVSYARCATGSRILRVASWSGILSAGDLLNATASIGGREGHLNDLLRGLGSTEQPVLLALENVNVFPVDIALVPLLRAQRSGGGPFPPNLLVGATLSEGPIRLPMAPSTWGHLALIGPTAVGGPPSGTVHPGHRRSPFPPSTLSLPQWQDLRHTASNGPVLRCAEVLEGLPVSLRLDLEVRDQALRLFAALCASGYGEDQALCSAIGATVLPSLPGQADALGAALAQQGLDADRVASLQAASKLVNE